MKKSSDCWKMFSTSMTEVKELFVSMGELTIGDNFLKIENLMAIALLTKKIDE